MATVFIPKSTTDLGGAGVANGDDVVFGEGQQSVVTNLNAWAAFASLNSINFDPRFTGTVGGGSAGSLLVDVDAGATQIVSYAAGGGALYLAAAGPSAVISRLKVIGNGQANLTGGTFTRVEQRSGRLNINSSTTVPNLFISGGEASAQFITGTSGYQLVRISGGRLDTERGLDSDFSGPLMQINGGVVTVGRTDSSSTVPTGTGSAASGVIEVNGGGTLIWRGGNIDTLRVFGGTVDFSGITQNISITTLQIDNVGLSKSTILGSRFFTVTNVSGGTTRVIYGADNDTTLP